MASAKRSKFQRQQDLVITQDMYLDGKSQLDIAHRLGVSQAQVSFDIQKIIQQWTETRFTELDRHRAEELAKLNRDEQRFTQLWLASLEFPAKIVQKSFSGKVRTKIVNGKPVMDDAASLPEYFRTSTTDDGSRGNPFFWEQIKWCRTERAKLLGLYAPKKIANTNIAGDEERSGQDAINAKDDMLNMLMQVADKMIPKNITPPQLAASVDGEIVGDENAVDAEEIIPENPEKINKDSVSGLDETPPPSIEPAIIDTGSDGLPLPDKIDPLSDKHFPVPEQATKIKAGKISRAENHAPSPYAREILGESSVVGVAQATLDFNRNSGIQAAKQVNDYVESAHSEDEIHPLALRIRKRS